MDVNFKCVKMTLTYYNNYGTAGKYTVLKIVPVNIGCIQNLKLSSNYLE